jgi:hypothetical protein
MREEQVLPGSERGQRKRVRMGEQGGRGKMPQIMYAHTNKQKNLKRK